MASLVDLAHKVAGRVRLTDDDARQLASTTDLVTVGMVAAEARRLHAGEGVTFVRVAEIACGAAVPEDGWPAAARELRIVGAPASAGEAVATVRAVVATAGDRPVTGFSLADLWTLVGGRSSGLEALVRELAAAGLAAIADVPVDRFAGNHLAPAAPGKATTAGATTGGATGSAVATAETAALAVSAVIAAGLAAPVARWETVPADPVAALNVVRDLQERTRALQAFAPLPREAVTDPPQTGYDGVKLVALARVMLDNVPLVQVDWGRHGPKLAQVALLFGASDLDRVTPTDAAPLGHRRAPLEEVQRNIAAAFLKPIERDGRFVRVTDTPAAP